MLVQAGTIPLDVFHGLATQLQGGGFQRPKDLLLHQVVDHGPLEAETHLLSPLVEMSDATVIGLALAPIRRLEAPSAVAADDDAGQQSGAAVWAPFGART